MGPNRSSQREPSQGTEFMIELNNVTKRYRTQRQEVLALTDLSLQVDRGSYVAVRGRSGSGKSTLLSLIGGLALPTEGTIQVDGQNIAALSPAERAAYRASKVGFVFQMFHLLPYLNVLDNVLLAAADERRQACRQRATELLEEFGLQPRLTHRPAELSAGERQRVAMARALLNQPPLLLADEPTGNLDSENASALLDLLDRFQQAGGTVLLATHDPQAAERAGRQVVLERGKVIEDACRK